MTETPDDLPVYGEPVLARVYQIVADLDAHVGDTFEVSLSALADVDTGGRWRTTRDWRVETVRKVITPW